MRRLFCIWNRGYKMQHVIATDITEALEICAKSRHISRPNMYRRFADRTDVAQSEIIGCAEGMLDRALDFGKSGVAKLDIDHGWLIDGEPTWDTASDTN